MGNRNYSLDVRRRQGNIQIVREATKNGDCVLSVLLHGNKIFCAHYGERWIRFFMCGWYTPSTRDAINTALREFRPDMRIFKSNNIWRCSFANGEEESHLEACEGKKYSFGGVK